jgi:predicted signal transduction protein with EAL and GGDEF domain
VATSSHLLLERVPDAVTAERLAGRIHARLCEPLALPVGNVAVGASIGLIFLDRVGAAPDDALDVVDKAMYRAKRDGGGVRLATQSAIGASLGTA